MNYIGSKQSLLDFLLSSIGGFTGTIDGDYSGKIVCDGFAGTGAVSRAFRERGAKVVANDMQTYSFALLRHFVCNSTDDRMDKRRFETLNALEGVKGFVYRNYCAGSGSGRMYYTDENGCRCDAIRQEIERLRVAGEISENEYWWYLASLIESVDKVANTASVYVSFLKHYKKRAQRPLLLEPLPIVDGPVGDTHQKNIGALMPNVSCDILYLDPPYNSRQYPAYYHVLETIARYDAPVLHGKTGTRDYREQKSDWCVKSRVRDVFDDLLSKADCEFVFLSYNNEGLMSVDDVRGIMSRYGDYELKTQEYHRFRADKKDARNHKADKTVELLHCLRKK